MTVGGNNRKDNMTTLYKLTDQNGNTQNNCHWDVGMTHKNKECKNPKLCSKDVFHAYINKNLAFMLNPAYAAHAAAYAAARMKTLKKCADIFRKHFPDLIEKGA
jgi:hypothetical protein